MKQAKLKSAIKMANLTQGKIAESIGISISCLAYKMRGETSFTLDEALKICDILGIDNPRCIFETKGR